MQDAAAKQRIDAIETQYRMQAAALELSHRMGSVDAAAYEKAKARLDEMRGRIDQTTAAPLPEVDRRTAALAAPAPTAMSDSVSTGDGIIGNILGALGFGGAEPALAEQTPITPPNVKSEVKVKTFGSGSCKKTGLGKRCKIGS